MPPTSDVQSENKGPTIDASVKQAATFSNTSASGGAGMIYGYIFHSPVVTYEEMSQLASTAGAASLPSSSR